MLTPETLPLLEVDATRPLASKGSRPEARARGRQWQSGPVERTRKAGARGKDAGARREWSGVETILKKRGETIAATAIETYIERGLS